MKKNIKLLSVSSKEFADEVEKCEWENFIFLPFQTVWQFFVISVIIFNAVVVIFDHFYNSKEMAWIPMSHYIGDFIYFIDTILLFLHRIFIKIRKKRVYKKTPLKFLTIDIISLLPISLIRLFIKSQLWNRNNIDSTTNRREYIDFKFILRLYRVLIFFNKKTDEVGYNELLILTTSHLIRLLLVSHISGAIIYSLRGSDRSWIRNLSEYRINKNSPYSWAILCYTLMASLGIHSWHGTIKPETNLEKHVFMITMLLGFTIHVMLFFGYLTSMFRKIYTDYFVYKTRAAKIVRLMNDWNVDDNLKKRTSEYYSVFWQKRQGIKDMPKMFEVLPISLRKEVTVDLFWEALRHSHFFVGTDIFFKRSLSLVMKNEFLLPGDFLFRIGEPKGKLVYLVSGVLQILSDEDDNSPILSFSRGTLLGETACLLAAKSIANLRSATYCEIQTLALTDLHRVFVDHPNVAKYVKKQMYDRIDKATRMQKKRMLSTALPQEKTNLNVAVDPAIKKLKQRWRQVYAMHTKQKLSGLATSRFDSSISVANFDLIVLSSDVELRVDSICLSGQCPYVMDPDNSFRVFCNFVIFAAVIIQSLIIPQAAFFKRKLSPIEDSLCFLMDMIYILDIYLQLSTAIKDRTTLITNFQQILLTRFKQSSFVVDLIAAAPIDYLVRFGSERQQIMVLCKLVRLLKTYKVYSVLKIIQTKMVLDIMTIKILKYACLYFFLIYWLTCLLYGLSCPREPCDENSWFLHTSKIYGLTMQDIRSKFSASLYLTLTLFINFGENSYDGFIESDILLLHIVALIGHLIYSYGFSELTATLVLKYQTKKLSYGHLLSLKREANLYNIPPYIQKRVQSFLYFHYSVIRYELIGNKSILINAPLELKNEIIRHRVINSLRMVPLFADSSDDLLRYICVHSELKLVPANAAILSFESKSDVLYVIMNGYCRMYSSLPGDLERQSSSVLQLGDTFPFLESFHDAFSFMSVESLTAVEILVLPIRIILNAFQTDERDDGCFKSALAYHRQVYGSILYRKGARLPMLRPVEPSKSRGDMFDYAIYDVDYVKYSEAAFREPFMRLGGWSFIRVFLLRNTINPNKTFYIVWEIGRCTFAFAHMIILIIYPNILVVRFSVAQIMPFFYFFTASCLVDIYIRLHCQYYNDKGILVTHPLSTAVHYVSTSFVIDAVGLTPIQSIGLHHLFGTKYQLCCAVIMSFSTRFLQLYRLYYGMTLWENTFEGIFQYVINVAKYMIFMLVTLGVMSAVFQLLTCDIENGTFSCNTWLIEELYKDKSSTISNHLLFGYYKVSTYFTLSTSGNPTYFSYVTVAIIIIMPLYVMRCAVLSQITSKGIGGNIELTLYRDRMKNYLDFLKHALVDSETIYAIVTHYEYMWKKSKGMNMYRVMKYFHLQLEQDVTYSLYANCLERALVFQGEHHILGKAISLLLNREYYTKDSKIIQCNDVQSKIFFVQEGCVEISIANTTLSVLSEGGMFGCLCKGGTTRQTLTAVAVVHSTVLTIESKTFHSIVASFPNVQERVRKLNMLNCEYLQESDAGEGKAPEQTSSLYDRHKEFFDYILIRHDSDWYAMYSYINNMHISPLTALLVLGAAVINIEEEADADKMYLIIYILDIVHIVEIVIKFHVMYEDPVSGKVINDPYAIRKRFIRSTFWYHIFTIIPFDLIVSGYSTQFVARFCTLNRVARCIFLFLYYNESEAKLAMKKHLRWTFMIYKYMFFIQLMVCAWVATCSNARCSYNDSISKANASIRSSETLFDSVTIAYLHVINIYTTCGLRSVMPNTSLQLLVTILISLATLLMTATLCSGFTSLIVVQRHNFSVYVLKLNRLWTYLEARELSPFLLKKVWNYCLILWEWQQGSWLPALIQEAPASLKQNILKALYGKHLSNHYLFSNTHVDFLRQLVAHFERTVFLPGYSIVEKGDFNCCMYFIHKGEVDVIQVEGKIEITVKTLTEGMSFGEAQGLLSRSHLFSYRANTAADILILDKNRWKYLLKWFPASNEEIIEKAIENNLFSKEESYGF